MVITLIDWITIAENGLSMGVGIQILNYAFGIGQKENGVALTPMISLNLTLPTQK